jgi:hypothetical protein
MIVARAIKCIQDDCGYSSGDIYNAHYFSNDEVCHKDTGAPTKIDKNKWQFIEQIYQNKKHTWRVV